MMRINLEELMATRLGSVDPARFPGEVFDLYSVPAFDRGLPEVLSGRDIGSSKQIVQSGDVLISRIVPHIRRAWIVGANRGRRQIASGEWIVFRSTKIFPKYLRYQLIEDHFHAQFMQTVAGVGGSLLRARPSQVADIEIRLPELPEQKALAQLLSSAEQLVQARRHALRLCDEFLPAAFLKMFGDFRRSTSDVEVVELNSIAEIVSGVTKGQRHNGKTTITVPYLRVANVQDGHIDLSEIKTITVPVSDAESLLLQSGDVLMTEGGDYDKLGRGAIWHGEVDDCIHQTTFLEYA